MNPGNASLALRDIHLPEPVSWWPPAPGWWLVLIIVIGLLALIPFLIKWLRYKPINKTAMQAFQGIKDDYKNHQDKQQLVQQLSILLRRTCMSYVGRQQTASVTGQAWIAQLNQLSNENIFTNDIADTLLNAPYQPNNTIDSDQLLQLSQQWFDALPGKPLQ